MHEKPGLHMRQDVEITQEQRQLNAMQLRQMASSNNGVIVNTLREVQREMIRDFADRDEMTRRILQNDVHRHAHEGVIARRVIHRAGEDMAAFMRDHGPESHDEVILDLYDRVRRQVGAALTEWRATRDFFTRSPDPDPDKPFAFDQLAKLEDIHPTVTFRPFERVREASYRRMIPQDIQYEGRPGPVQRSYDEALLSEAKLRKAIRGQMKEFKKDTEGGGFVNPSGPVLKNVLKDMSSRRGIYQGWVLESMEEGLEAFILADLFPDHPGATRRLLKKGVAGKLRFNETPTKYEHLANEAEVIIQFDTIRGDNREDKSVKGPSGARLFLKYMAEVMRHPRNRQLIETGRKPKMILYACRDLTIWPQDRTKRLPHLEDRPVPIGSNLASPKFFTDRGFIDFGFDSHPKGPYAVHHVDGEAYNVRPSWVWLFGDIEEIYDRSASIWRSIQWKHGDYSRDI